MVIISINGTQYRCSEETARKARADPYVAKGGFDPHIAKGKSTIAERVSEPKQKKHPQSQNRVDFPTLTQTFVNATHDDKTYANKTYGNKTYGNKTYGNATHDDETCEISNENSYRTRRSFHDDTERVLLKSVLEWI